MSELQELLQKKQAIDENIVRLKTLDNLVKKENGLHRSLAIELEDIGVSINPDLYPEAGQVQTGMLYVTTWIASELKKKDKEKYNVGKELLIKLQTSLREQPTLQTLQASELQVTEFLKSSNDRVTEKLERETYNAGEINKYKEQLVEFHRCIDEDTEVIYSILHNLVTNLSAGNYNLDELFSTSSYGIEQELVNIFLDGSVKDFINTLRNVTIGIQDTLSEWERNKTDSDLLEMMNMVDNHLVVRKHLKILMQIVVRKYS